MKRSSRNWPQPLATNKTNCLLLSSPNGFTLKGLRTQPDEIESVLFGVAGFLGAPDLAGFAPGTRQYLRVLWDRWWPQRAESGAAHSPAAHLAPERDAPPQSPAAPSRRARRHCGGLADDCFVR